MTTPTPMTGRMPTTSPVVRSVPERQAARWVRWFIIIQIACQLALIGPISGLRTVVRLITFVSGLVFIALVQGKGGPHPARTAAYVVVVVLGLSTFHPTAASFPANMAQAALYISIMAPLFWVPRLAVGTEALKFVLMVLWAFHSVGSLAGVLQVYFPGTFDPKLSPVMLSMPPGYLKSLMIVTSSGTRVFRPMGLTDSPGGAAGSGFYAVVLGLGIFLTVKNRIMLVTAIASALLGLMCLYLCQIRSLVVLTAISVLAVTGVLALRRDYRRLGGVGVVVALLIVVSLRSATSLASTAVESRLGTLTAGSPSQVYARNRGAFLTEAFNDLLPKYPVGAGIGRWGMMHVYFGDNSRTSANTGLWAEIQWTGWVLDGGWPLILGYVAALVTTLWTTLRIARRSTGRDPTLALWGAVIAGYSIGVVALTFSFPVFVSQGGMEFWLLNTLLFTAARTQAQWDEWNRTRLA